MQDRFLTRLDENRWEIPQSDEMRVAGRIYANSRLAMLLSKDNSLKQVRNVAMLPGIVGYSIAMPDIHEGYGFPIGGVAAMDYESGVISPGGVGYDINCGVRLIKTNLFLHEIKERLKTVVDRLNNAIPTGVGSKGAIHKLSLKDLEKIMVRGAEWAIENGFGSGESLEYMEEKGAMTGANPDFISNKAKTRGIEQMGTLGSGNHFIEIGCINQIYDETVANYLGLQLNQIVILIHSGSRGFGHQICDDYIGEMKRNRRQEDFYLPDTQLISTFISSPLGKKYYAAMVCAANYAWSNRQVMMALVEKELLEALKISEKELGYTLIYDVSHNIAKIEEHTFEGEKRKLCVHRKGATRAFGPHHPLIPVKYQSIGQPVIIPGDMGRYSYLCLGTEAGMHETFGSSCHGAGRVMSRKEALRTSSPDKVLQEMKHKNILIHSATKTTLVEEMSSAYKDVSAVVDTMTDCGLLKKVIMMKPIGVIKG
ncbi:MAG: RtcB family protein [Candidatus Cloacimonetes bacterium]|nr:RtcB family protein [Candidatus Cloacimonadota bacterium]